MKVSEVFYSIQGEGMSAGCPAVFIRLTGCNMVCGGPAASFVKQGNATWHCDTEEVWRKGVDMDDGDLAKCIMSVTKDVVDYEDPSAVLPFHLVFTGGEPLLQQQEILSFLNDWNRWQYRIITGHGGAPHRLFQYGMPFVELETNGTLEAADLISQRIDQVNCSPKLKSSGVKALVRTRPMVIRQIAKHRNAWFKFVVSDEADWTEVQETFIDTGLIKRRQVILMPATRAPDEHSWRETLVDLGDVTQVTFELAKRHGARACSRLQILAWQKVTGV